MRITCEDRRRNSEFRSKNINNRGDALFEMDRICRINNVGRHGSAIFAGRSEKEKELTTDFTDATDGLMVSPKSGVSGRGGWGIWILHLGNEGNKGGERRSNLLDNNDVSREGGLCFRENI